MFADIIKGAIELFSVINMIFMLAGTVLGLIVGILPGMGGSLALAILLPIVFGMKADAALIMLLAIFGASRFGGAFGGILLNIPGTASSAATALDGYPMNLKGESENAIMFANVASVVGGFIGSFLLLVCSPLIAKFALRFGAPEYALVAIFGLTIIASLSREDMLKGLIAGCIGVLLGTIGTRSWRGYPRFDFHLTELMSKMSIVWVLIAVFGGAQAFYLVHEFFKEKSSSNDRQVNIRQKPFDIRYVLKKSFQMKYLLLRSGIIGSFIGAIPGVGGSVACWISYDSAKKVAKNSDAFGTGIPEGVAAGEALDNAAASGSVIPVLTLGIPGGAEAAVFMGALLLVGVELGPRLIIDEGPLVYEIILSLFVSTMMFFVLGIILVKPLCKLANLSINNLIPIIFCLAAVGTYGARNSVFGVYVFFVLGLLSYVLKMLKFPLPPIVIGFILGPIVEANLQRTLAMFKDNYWVVLARPISLCLILLTLTSLFLPALREFLLRRKTK